MLGEVLTAAVAGLAIFVCAANLAIGSAGFVPDLFARLRELGKFLNGRVASGVSDRDVYLVGSSVVGEGLDARLIEPLLPGGRRCFNLSWFGATPRELLLAAPAIARASPAMVVLCLSMSDMAVSRPVAAERAAYAAWSGLVAEEDVARLADKYSADEARPLREHRLLRLLRLRTLPVAALNGGLAALARPDLRIRGYERNFFAPWAIRRPISKTAAERLMKLVLADLDKQAPEAVAQTEVVLDDLFEMLTAGGSELVVVIGPQHPVVSARLEKSSVGRAALEMLRRTAKRHGAALLDHRDVLDEAMYAEAVHTYEPGRLRWSWVLGTELRALAAER